MGRTIRDFLLALATACFAAATFSVLANMLAGVSEVDGATPALALIGFGALVLFGLNLLPAGFAFWLRARRGVRPGAFGCIGTGAVLGLLGGLGAQYLYWGGPPSEWQAEFALRALVIITLIGGLSGLVFASTLRALRRA